jgi:localization factor PodJL
MRPEAREAARQAAQRSGMPMDEWLNSVILHQAAQEGVDPNALHEGYGEDISSVHARLDEITHRLDRMTRAGSGPAAYAPPHVRHAPQPIPAPARAQPPMTLGGIDQAVAEITARRAALSGAPMPQPAPARPLAAPQVVAPLPPMRVPLPSQDLSGLEEQLRQITSQIETLRQPGVEEAINALRDELGGIANAVTEAMPQRAIDAIEKQIHGLSQRITEGRQAGIDGNMLAGIEHGLAEVRDALRGLTPAESLIGFNDAVSDLARKIDLIVAEKDPATIQQLESAITTLRGLSGHIADNETVGQLAGQVQALTEKIESLALSGQASDALNHLEQRINALSDAIEQRTQNGGNVPPKLEALVASLADKIEQIQMTRGGGESLAAGHLEDRIVKLVEKLDASDSRLSHLEAIERGLADLLLMQASNPGGGLRAEGAPNVDMLKHEMARTQDALDTVQGTLGSVVDRLAMIEQGMHGQPDPEEMSLKQPIGRVAARLVSDVATQPEPQPAPPPAPAPLPMTAEPPPQPKAKPMMAVRAPINPDLPPDQPLEPGSGPPPLRASTGMRIAAAEGALGAANPVATAGAKSGFIAAARRAAHAAAYEPASSSARVTAEEMREAASEEPEKRSGGLMNQIKKMFVTASAIAIVVGSIQIASNILGGDEPTKIAQKPETAPAIEAKSGPFEASSPSTTAAIDNPAIKPADPASGKAGANILNASPSLTNQQPNVAMQDTTGSIPRVTPRQADPKLPIAIGSIKLRDAATAGDAVAAYEIANRLAEGRGVPANNELAAQWLERAANAGLAPAQFRLGGMYEKGIGVRKDLRQARRLYLAAAAKGNAKAMHNLAVLYAEGIDGKPDYGTAAEWFRKAAQRGVPDSQYNLGILYARGLGVDRNLSESCKWFALAAAQGDREALKKRDEVAARLDPKTVAAVQESARTFIAEPQPQDAINVAEPEGGWDSTAPDKPAAKPARPKTTSAFDVGKR